MVVGKYLRTNINIVTMLFLESIEGYGIWDEEGEKLYASQRNVYLNSSLAQSVEKKRLELKSFEVKDALSWDAAAAALRRSSK